MKRWILLAGLAVATSSVVAAAPRSHVPAKPPAPVCQLSSDSATVAAADGCPYTGGGY
ncbi:MAG: hypothetical protein JWM18_2365 [Chloroflexi bacterium]|nr:hypothetical protein [Chloroflexota bacterium]